MGRTIGTNWTAEERRDALYRQTAKPLNVDTLRERLGQQGQMADRPGMMAYFEKLVRSEGVAEGAGHERERIRGLSREFKAGDTLIINAPTLLVELSVLRPRKHGPASKEGDNGNN